jgi:hypothetical protein
MRLRSQPLVRRLLTAYIWTSLSRLYPGRAKIRADDDHSRRHSSVPHTLRCVGVAGRSRTLSTVVFVERGSVQPWSFGIGPDARRMIPTGVFRTSDIEQMRMGVLEHLGIAQAPAWLCRGTQRRYRSTSFSFVRALCRALRFGPPAAGCPRKFASLSNTWRRLSHLCSQFNPRPS